MVFLNWRLSNKKNLLRVLGPIFAENATRVAKSEDFFLDKCFVEWQDWSTPDDNLRHLPDSCFSIHTRLAKKKWLKIYTMQILCAIFFLQTWPSRKNDFETVASVVCTICCSKKISFLSSHFVFWVMSWHSNARLSHCNSFPIDIDILLGSWLMTNYPKQLKRSSEKKICSLYMAYNVNKNACLNTQMHLLCCILVCLEWQIFFHNCECQRSLLVFIQ